MPVDRIDAIVSLAKRRGFVYPSGEVYGAARTAWDYGPLGVELKENLRRQWWRAVVTGRDDVVGLDSAVVQAPEMWAASGHVDGFADPLTECRSCHRRYRADRLCADGAELAERACPACGSRGSFTEPHVVSGLVRTWLGPAGDAAERRYLRPELAQGIVVNFLNVLQSARRKPPFGIAQVGRAFRNEIEPGDFIFRTREFEQLAMGFFAPPGGAAHWHEYWLGERCRWYTDLGISERNLRRAARSADGRAVDLQYRFRFPDAEFDKLESVVDRGEHDLVAHSRASGTDLSYFDQASGERWFPAVIEPAAGLDRAMLAFLLESYDVDEAPNTKGGVDSRTVLRLDPRLSPVKAAVLPLSRNAELSPKARGLAAALRRRWNVEFDDAGAIGRRYRRQDEIGTPFCVTVDFDTLSDNGVTIRDRDSMKQERVSLDQAERYLLERLAGC